MSTPYWHYFISLEKDFIRTLDYVELAASNSATYSDNFAKLILAAGSEVDVVAKALCNAIASGSRANNIVEYRGIITGAFQNIHSASVLITRTGAAISPWSSWDPQILMSPTWWTAYNNIKHDRVSNFTRATQENALFALTGLLVFNRYFHFVTGQNGNVNHPEPFPDLLDAGAPSFLVGRVAHRGLPGIS